MLREAFAGRNPSHFYQNSITRVIILAESFVWSAWNSVTPIFAIFVANNIPGGNAEIAGSVFSVFLLVRVLFELLSGNYFAKSSDDKKLVGTRIGFFIMGLSYIGFAFSHTILHLFIFSAVAGLGAGIGTPLKNTLFAKNVNSKKETFEWGVYDAVVFVAMAMASALGGFIAHQYGFRMLFLLAAVINFLGVITYLSYINPKTHQLNIAKKEEIQ